MLGVVEHVRRELRPRRVRRRTPPAGRCRRRRSRCSSPSILTVASIVSVPPSVSAAMTFWRIRSSGRTGVRYSSAKTSHISFERHLAALAVGDLLDRLGELDLQPPRQHQAVVGLHDVGDAALAGLRVDPDDGLVGAADVLRVDRQVRAPATGCRRHPRPPRRRAIFIASRPLLIASWWLPENAVYTRSPPYGWRSCTGSWLQYSTVRRISSMLEKSICGSTPRREQVHPQRHQADVAGALAVAEQAALDPVRARLDSPVRPRRRRCRGRCAGAGTGSSNRGGPGCGCIHSIESA